MPLTYREIAEILRIIDASDCEELVLELEGVRLVVRRQGSARVEELSGAGPAPEPPPQGARARTAEGDADDGDADAPPAIEARADGRVEIRAPMVGTFYRAPSPAEPPFVERGDEVQHGAALCLLEVMKLFTTIESTVGGRVVEIAAEDGALVEYGQTLFVIEPADDET